MKPKLTILTAKQAEKRGLKCHWHGYNHIHSSGGFLYCYADTTNPDDARYHPDIDHCNYTFNAYTEKIQERTCACGEPALEKRRVCQACFDKREKENKINGAIAQQQYRQKIRLSKSA